MNSKKLYTLVKKEIPLYWISSQIDAKEESESSSANILSTPSIFMTIYSDEELNPSFSYEKWQKKIVKEYDKKLQSMREMYAWSVLLKFSEDDLTYLNSHMESLQLARSSSQISCNM